MMFKLLCVSLLYSCNSTLLDRFENWVHEFSISFRDRLHFNQVYNTWINNDKFIEDINSRNYSYKLGHNHFSGMDSNQFRVFMGFDNQEIPVYDYFSKNAQQNFSFIDNEGIFNMENLPKSVDWVSAGAVTPVKDQGQCGSCWSFSTTGALEGSFFSKYGYLESFSEQQLVDCDTRRNGGKDMGCKGGIMDNAFSWIKNNGGLCLEADYPYVSGTTKTQGTCLSTCKSVEKSDVHEIIDVTPSSEIAMMTALSKQPISIAIEADQREFQLYKSGVFTGTCGTKLDHGVLLVGYGTFDGIDYWKVKNSWSSSWGEKGYILLGKGNEYNSGDGQCGLLLQGSYPLL